MPLQPASPSPPPDRELARQRLLIKIVIAVLLVMAALAITVVPRLALPIRVFVALSDVALAAVLWLVLRQKFSGK